MLIKQIRADARMTYFYPTLTLFLPLARAVRRIKFQGQLTSKSSNNLQTNKIPKLNFETKTQTILDRWAKTVN